MSQTKVKKPLPEFDIVEFFEGARTERGEKVYSHMDVEFHPFGGFPIRKRLKCDKGIGITEEWIEDTIKGCLEGLEKDYPNDVFEVVRVKPNFIKFVYSGTKGVVN